MRRDLYGLLQERSIVHPTRVEAITWRQGRLSVEVSGWRWWDASCPNPATDGAITFVFDEVTEGRFLLDRLDRDDEMLDEFEIRLVAETPWARSADWSIYCSAAVPDPLAIYVAVEDYLRRNEARFGVEDFLNQGSGLRAFIEMTKAPGFLLARAPECIRDLICEELDRQCVRYSVVQTVADTESRFLVTLGRSTFFCEGAIAEMLEQAVPTALTGPGPCPAPASR
ncbi:hypothetical protein AS593_21765 [Caulobacter vibrioides]|nr:hypothetical protein AS593_21765 [Caulobacter vibrioides]